MTTIETSIETKSFGTPEIVTETTCLAIVFRWNEISSENFHFRYPEIQKESLNFMAVIVPIYYST
jgi:hypothetical protein